MSFSVKNVKIEFPFLFFAVCVFFLSSPMKSNYVCAILFSLFHEAGHVTAMCYFRQKPEKITFLPIGIRITCTSTLLSYSAECVISAAGPVVSLFLAVVFSGDVYSLPFAVNTGLFVINMLPLKSLDAGRFIYCLSAMKTDTQKAEKILFACETASIVLMAAILVFSFFYNCVNTSFVMFTVFFTVCVISDIKRIK